MPHIFISYSKQDIDFARHLKKQLEAQNFAVWMDETRLVPSDRWWPQIEQNVQTCAAFIVIMSPNSKQSDWVEREILFAERLRKPIFPVLLAGEDWPRLANIQYTDMRTGIAVKLPPTLLDGLRAVVPTLQPRRRASRRLPRRLPVRRVLMLLVAVLALLIAAGAIIVLLAVLFGGDEPAEKTIKGVTLVEVPGGCFLMGSDDGRPDEHPPHEVCLDTFWIGKTEVTNRQYLACVNDGVCPPVPPYGDNGRFFDDPALADLPVVNVTWFEAMVFAEWLGGTLPSEAQWEYAARGEEARPFPWGDGEPTCERANVAMCGDEPFPAGELAKGKSWVGAHDMAGNVWEWVHDWYSETFYAQSEPGARNPTGPPSGGQRVLRGGSFLAEWCPGRTACREAFDPDFRNTDVGFRVMMEDSG